MKKRKYDYSVREATQIAFHAMPERFPNYLLFQKVKQIRSSYYLSDGTILVRLRELRREHKVINYRADNNGFYTKVCNCDMQAPGEGIKCNNCKLPIKELI